MVSLWPWRGVDSSPASFEKALSALSTKITTTQARLDSLRTSSRRVKLLSTLYLSFAYLVYTIVDLLVIGWQKMGPWEWAGVAGGPVFIYVTRTSVAAVYNLRIDSMSSRLKDLQSERAKTIQKLKDATKYDSTLELLEKYGGPESKPTRKGKKGKGDDEEGPQPMEKKPRASLGATGGRTTMPPPPTANILRGDSRGPGTPVPGTPVPAASSQLGTPQAPHSASRAMGPSAEFAPNAFTQGDAPTAGLQQYEAAGGSHWYDRVLDLLLGEDETASKNRIVLICKNCRLVNGQAPPGTKSLAELGTWKCMACGALNGEVDEGKRIVREVLAQTPARGLRAPVSDGATSEGDNEDGSSDLVEVEKEDETDGQETEAPKAEQPEQGAMRRRKGKSKK